MTEISAVSGIGIFTLIDLFILRTKWLPRGFGKLWQSLKKKTSRMKRKKELAPFLESFVVEANLDRTRKILKTAKIMLENEDYDPARHGEVLERQLDLLIGSPLDPEETCNAIVRAPIISNLTDEYKLRMATEFSKLRLVRRGHFELPHRYCTHLEFDVRSLFLADHTQVTFLGEMRDFMCRTYVGKGLTDIFLLTRKAPVDEMLPMFLLDGANRINERCEVHPLPRSDRLEFWDRSNNNILIIEPLTLGDAFLEQVIKHFQESVKAEVVGVIELIALHGTEQPIACPQVKIDTGMVLDLGVAEREHCRQGEVHKGFLPPCAFPAY